MNIPIVLAIILCAIAFFLHTFVGDKELKLIEPDPETDDNYTKQEKWTMARSTWHLFSFDLLFAGIGLSIINFTDFFTDEKLLLQILAIYFFGYGLFWLIGVAISKKFPMNYLRLGQWILLWLISGFIFWGM